MLGGLLVLILVTILAFGFINYLKRKYPFVNKRLLTQLYFYHVFLSAVYYSVALFNPSDSKAYYLKVQIFQRGESWMDFYGTSTTFIEFLAYPLVHYFLFTYEACMVTFQFFGFMGFCFFYLFFEENTKVRTRFFRIDAIYFFLFLPNAHFWSSSLGKGSVVFLGMGLYFWSLGKIDRRKLALVLGLLIIYHVRPHILLTVLISTLIAFLMTSRGVSPFYRVLSLIVGAIILANIYFSVLEMVGLEEDLTETSTLSNRAFELTKATSGVDITNYNFAEKLFTFIYRPLFFDSPGLMGMVVSVENLIYIIISLSFFDSRVFGFLRRAPFYVLTGLLSFVTVSILLAQITGNLGLAIRQKSQVIFLFFFVLLKLNEYKAIQQLSTRKNLFRRHMPQDAGNLS